MHVNRSGTRLVFTKSDVSQRYVEQCMHMLAWKSFPVSSVMHTVWQIKYFLLASVVHVLYGSMLIFI